MMQQQGKFLIVATFHNVLVILKIKNCLRKVFFLQKWMLRNLKNIFSLLSETFFRINHTCIDLTQAI